MEIDFVWDAGKEKRNIAKHGIDFSAAKQVFFDPSVIIVEEREADGEVRYHVIGQAQAGMLLLTVFVDRSEAEKEIIRIISAREATRYEQKTYASQFEERN